MQQALNKATQLAVNFINQEKSVASKALGFFKRRSKNTGSVKDQEPLPPELPPAGNRLKKNIPLCPLVEVQWPHSQWLSSGLSSPGLSPGQGHFIVFEQDALLSQCLSLLRCI